MSTDNANKITPPSITRNGVTLTLKEAVFSPKSDKHKGKIFFTPEMELPKLEYRESNGTREAILTNIDSLVWAGLDQVVGSFDKVARGVFGRIAADIYEDTANNGEFNMEEFIEQAQDFQAARQSLSDIGAELEDLMALQMKYAFDPVFMTAMSTQVFTPEAIELQKKVQEIATKAQQLKSKKEQLESEYARRAQLRKDRESAKKALAGTTAK